MTNDSGKFLLEEFEDFLGLAGAVEIKEESLLSVVVDEGLGILLIDVESVEDCFFLVVLSLDEGLTCLLVDSFHLGRIEENVLCPAC